MSRALLTLTLAATLTTACSSGRSSPSPPPPTVARLIGEAEVVDGDTLWVLRGTGYELRSPTRAILPAAQEGLDDAARSFARYFAEEPPTIDIRVELIERDSTGMTGPSPRPRRVDGTLILPVPADFVPTRGPRQITLNGAAVAWVWLAEYVQKRRPADAAEVAPGRLGLPAWLEVAAASVVAGSRRRLDVYLMALAQQQDQLLPLEQLFTATGDSLFTPIPALPSAPPPQQARQRGGPPGRGAIMLQGVELFVAQSIGVAHFVTAREGFGSLGRLTRGILEHQTMEEFLAGSRWLPKDLPSLEEAWLYWLNEVGGRTR